MTNKILIIEDELAILENLIEIITTFGYDVIAADNGNEGIKLAIENAPDLIICDILMPGINGLDVLKKLQENEITASIPFIFLTAKADKPSIRYGMELGADDYLTKPFTPNQLQKTIETRLRKKEQTFEAMNKKIDILKSSLATSLPHEFRTPLNGILASSEFLIKYYDNLPIEDIKQLHLNIHNSASRLHRHIVNFLLYSEINILKNQTDLEKNEQNSPPMYLPSDIAYAVFYKYTVMNNRYEDLHFLSKGSNYINVKQEHFYKICEELADNAFKFSEKGTPIEVSLDSNNNKLIMKIKDFGRGMTYKQIKEISAYTQFDRNLYEQQGLGLGLAIVIKLCNYYGGEFAINSVPNSFTEIEIKFKTI